MSRLSVPFLLKTMGIQAKVCELCLKICDNFRAIEEDTKKVLDVVLLPKIDLAAIIEPVICTNCTEMLTKCFEFKSACLNIFDYIVPFVNKDDVKVDLKDVYLSKNESGIGVPETQSICGFCMGLVQNCSAIALNFEEGDMLKNMIKKCFPELDLSVIENPKICETCHESLEKCFLFVTNCLVIEEKIEKYYETLDINSRGRIKLTSLLQFMINFVTSEMDGSPDDVIKSEKQFSKEIGFVDEGEIDKERDIFELERIIYDEEEVDYKNESFMDFGVQTFNPKNIFCNEESNGAIGITETYCKEDDSPLAKGNPVEMENQMHLDNENIGIKNDEQDLNRLENYILPQQEVAETLYGRQEYLMPNLDANPSQPYIKRSSTNENVTKTTYKCESCSYHAKCKSSIERHVLIHKDPSEIAMYKCNSCSYQAKRHGHLKKHLLVHKDPSEIEMYKCNSCPYQAKHKGDVKKHSLTHKDPSEIAMYKCNSCSYEAKEKGNLRKHVLIHKGPSEAVMYKCNFCSYQAKRNDHLKKHLLIHRDPSEIVMYKCSSCSYQTKHKGDVKKHLLIHKDPSEIAMYKCNSCSYQTKEKSNLKKHILVHKDSSEILMYKCNFCSFQAKQKIGLQRHLSLHKDPSEIPMYKCNFCTYQAKEKYTLKRHLVVHKDPSKSKSSV